MKYLILFVSILMTSCSSDYITPAVGECFVFEGSLYQVRVLGQHSSFKAIRAPDGAESIFKAEVKVDNLVDCFDYFKDFK